MHHGQSASLGHGRLPLFVFPQTVTFYADDQASHKQIVTVYNIYDFPIKFKVLATKPDKYVFTDTEGTIQPVSGVDIVVRHTAINSVNHGVTDKFRFQIYELGHRQVIGKKDITATLQPGKPDVVGSSGEAEHFQQVLPPSSPHAKAQQYSIGAHRAAGGTGPSLVVIMAAIVCIAALMLPTDGLDISSLPSYLHLSVNQKLILSFTLGLVAMVILRT